MKKVFLTFALIAATLVTINAQQELGLRFGSYSGKGGVAIDGIISTGDFSRIHADLSFGQGVGVDLLWDFIYRPLGGEAFNWYAGVGPFAFVPFDSALDWGIGAIGEIGLAYTFNSVPISLSIDWRPYFRIIENTDISLGGGGFNVRYVF
ncbi:MAG: outer membrane insertion C- signal [Bacteroidota bacterium]